MKANQKKIHKKVISQIKPTIKKAGKAIRSKRSPGKKKVVRKLISQIQPGIKKISKEILSKTKTIQKKAVKKNISQINKEIVPFPKKVIDPTIQLAAAIDVGSTGIRMVIAEIKKDSQLRIIESMQHPVSIGKDTFTKGIIQQETIEESVRILLGYKRLLKEYDINEETSVRAVATSSVREAANRDTFLDRLYIATHINIEAIEEAEENRLTYMAVRNILPAGECLIGNALIVEVGGGGTDLLLLENSHVAFSNSYRLGSLRMRETLATYRVPPPRMRVILDRHLRSTVDQLRRNVPVGSLDKIIAVSGDMRFAASKLVSDWGSNQISEISTKEFSKFADRIASSSIDQLVRKENLPYHEAETLGPALLAYKHLARAFNAKKLLVPKTSLREGLLYEMAAHGSWSQDFADQATNTALSLGQKFHFDEKHAVHVTELSIEIFRFLQEDHQLSGKFELLLRLSGLLHDIGMFISNRAHHKHSMYLILNSDLFGLTLRDKIVIGLIARYHRRAGPNSEHQEYAVLPRDHRMAVAKLSAILRVADALDRNHLQNIKNLSYSKEDGQFIISVPEMEDLTLERGALKEKANLFEDVYGLKVLLRKANG
ncbi:MAG: HD domain-containing protein [Candidatus Riflebacteria bacterium]|nr:HD domain-containing protein [Candidatus Riflebacteria bacterium]